jgi:hypothetical protein
MALKSSVDGGTEKIFDGDRVTLVNTNPSSTSWNTVDLSSYIRKGSKIAHLSLRVRTGTAGGNYWLGVASEAGTSSDLHTVYTQDTNMYNEGECFCQIDSSRQIHWRVSSANVNGVIIILHGATI